MVAVQRPSEEEMYLLAILQDSSGVDIAEFALRDVRNDDGCYRLHDYQWPWFTSQEKFQIDQGGRAVGKTESIKLRCMAFPFAHAGHSMLVTAPELNHLRPLTDEIEKFLLATRLTREIMPDNPGHGIARQPHWQVRFANGTSIISRLPNKDGRGVKGQHVLQLELDEGQDYPKAGWREVIECLNSDTPGAMFRVHGVSRGVPDEFYSRTQPNSGWQVHRPMAMMRPGWNKFERDSRIRDYGNSRQAVDYRRNVYGDHGDASNSVFVLSRLMDTVDRDEGSTYNSSVYTCIKLEYEKLPKDEAARIAYISNELQFPGSHKTGYSQKKGNKQVGSPNGYSAYWAGMDVGVTNHPSEILVFGQKAGTDDMELLTRVQMHRVNTDDQKMVVEQLFAFYGSKLFFSVDKTGVGFPVWDQLTRMPFGERVYGFGFSEKRIVAYEERELAPGETQEDLAIKRNVVEASTDWLRNDYVDLGRIRLPYDVEVLTEMQGQSYCCDEDTEILTRRGWLRYDQVRVGDETLGVIDQDGTPASVWTPIDAVNVFDAAPRQMVAFEGQVHHSLTTADHRWLVRPSNKSTWMTFKTSEELIEDTVRWRIPVTAERLDAPGEAKYDDDFVRIVAWYFTEGHLGPGGRIDITQSPWVNIEHCADIEQALTNLLGPGSLNAGHRVPKAGRPWSRTGGNSEGVCYDWHIMDREMRARIAEVCPGKDKVVAPDFLQALTHDQLLIFVETALKGDGCTFTRQRPDRQATHVRTFIQNHAGRMASFEMACALAGVPTHTVDKGDGKYVCTLLRRQYTHLSSMEKTRLVVDGVVWCPTTATGTWLARRHGSVFFTGNTVVKDNGDPYGQKRLFSGGSLHSLDAMKMMVAGRHIPQLEALLAVQAPQDDVIDIFIGAGGY